MVRGGGRGREGMGAPRDQTHPITNETLDITILSH